jgi:hypothetical protein
VRNGQYRPKRTTIGHIKLIERLRTEHPVFSPRVFPQNSENIHHKTTTIYRGKYIVRCPTKFGDNSRRDARQKSRKTHSETSDTVTRRITVRRPTIYGIICPNTRKKCRQNSPYGARQNIEKTKLRRPTNFEKTHRDIPEKIQRKFTVRRPTNTAKIHLRRPTKYPDNSQ